MVVQLFICLIVLAAASLLITQGRRRRIWSVLVLAGLCVVSYLFINSLNDASTGFIYQWLPYETLKADINISSSLRMQQMFVPLICLLAALVYLNTIYASEHHSLHFNTLMLLNFIALILLASSHDFLQLMFAGSMFSIIGFYMPDLIQPKKKIFIFNFLAEMSVFMALAIVYATTDSVSLRELSEYEKAGRHQDLVACLLLFAVGCKCGLFLLNGQYFDLKDVLFNRILGIMALSVPLSGLVLADRLYPLFQASSIPGKVLPWWCLISIIVAFVSAVINNNLKSKVISLFLALYAYMLLKISGNSNDIYFFAPNILTVGFIVAVVFIIAFEAASGEKDVGLLGGFWRYTRFNFVLSMIMVASVAAIMSNGVADTKSVAFGLGYLGIVMLVLRLIYFGSTRADEKVVAFAKNVGPLYWLPMLLGAVFLMWQNDSWQQREFYMLFAYATAVFLFIPGMWAIKIGNLPILHNDILSNIYELVLISPLRFWGRILWLVFDVVLIEHNIIGSISETFSAIISFLHSFQESKTRNYILSILCGMGIIAFYLGYYVYE